MLRGIADVVTRSNTGIRRSQSTAVAQRVACPEGIEPPTHSLEGCCSIQLSYGQLKNPDVRVHKITQAITKIIANKEKRPANQRIAGREIGRSTRIRTLDPLVPNQVRYQAAPHSEAHILTRYQRFWYCCLPNNISRATSLVWGLRNSAMSWQPRCTAGRCPRLSNHFLRWG
jgi:hypothetical protein